MAGCNQTCAVLKNLRQVWPTPSIFNPDCLNFRGVVHFQITRESHFIFGCINDLKWVEQYRQITALHLKIRPRKVTRCDKTTSIFQVDFFHLRTQLVTCSVWCVRNPRQHRRCLKCHPKGRVFWIDHFNIEIGFIAVNEPVAEAQIQMTGWRYTGIKCRQEWKRCSINRQCCIHSPSDDKGSLAFNLTDHLNDLELAWSRSSSRLPNREFGLMN